jgi:hypothetical protein
MFVDFVIQHTMRMHHIVCHLWPAQLYNIFPHYLLKGTIFGNKNKILEHKTYFDFLY